MNQFIIRKETQEIALRENAEKYQEKLSKKTQRFEGRSDSLTTRHLFDYKIPDKSSTIAISYNKKEEELVFECTGHKPSTFKHAPQEKEELIRFIQQNLFLDVVEDEVKVYGKDEALAA